MNLPRYSVDPRCYELAEYFAPESDEAAKQKLAQAIQDAVENWINWNIEAETDDHKNYL